MTKVAYYRAFLNFFVNFCEPKVLSPALDRRRDDPLFRTPVHCGNRDNNCASQ